MNYLIHVSMYVVHFLLLFSFVCLFGSVSFSEMNEFNYCLNNFLPRFVGRVVVKASVSPSGIPACMHSLNQCK